MSKSLGNSPEPLDLIQNYGADGVRIGMLLCSPAGNDLMYDDSLPEQGRNFANKIWNAFRLVKQWEVDDKIPQPASSVVAVNWMEEALKKGVAEIDHNFEKFRISEALMSVYKLFWDEFSAWYLEIIKPEYQKPIDRKTYEATLSLFDNLMRLIHPFMPFITEEIWQLLRERKYGESIMISRLPELSRYDKKLISGFEQVKDTISNIRTVRKEKDIPNREKIELDILKSDEVPDKEFFPVIIKMCNLSEIRLVDVKPEGALSFMTGTVEYCIPVTGVIDIEAELKKIDEEIAYHRGFLVSVMKKLDNEQVCPERTGKRY